MTKYTNIREEELKERVGEDFFAKFDCKKKIGNIDFCVCLKQEPEQPQLFDEPSLLWAEAKKAEGTDLLASIAQLILTIGKAKIQDEKIPPLFLGAFDAGRIAFVPYEKVQHIFSLNDFNWNVVPSNHNTKEFEQLVQTLKVLQLSKSMLLYDFSSEEALLKAFIKKNFRLGIDYLNRIQVTINNFVHIYLRWLQAVKPTININWEMAKKEGFIDADFYLADILSEDNLTLQDKINILLKTDHYEQQTRKDTVGFTCTLSVGFTDNQQAHTLFWNKYARPPRRDLWGKIIGRRDLLVPQDVRERKGSYFTPARWVELSQQYIADELGEDWQDNYYVWDCAAGTGNLLAGLTNKYHIWASTLDQADVDVMQQRIQNGANLLSSHVFRFDFLNDPLTNLPTSLQAVINDEQKRKHLVIYINPPYAEAATPRTKMKTGENKENVARNNETFKKYHKKMGLAANELFTQFLMRIDSELRGCVLAEFSKLKVLQAPGCAQFRSEFQPRLCRMCMLPADTFDNVRGQFPIGFKVWRTDERETFNSIIADVYDSNGEKIGTKTCAAPPDKVLTDWMKTFHDKEHERIAYLRMLGSDVQNNNGVFLTLSPSTNDIRKRLTCDITAWNLIPRCVYLAVRHCIEATWLNDRDQFLYPSEGWKADKEFQGDCLAFTLFHGQNRISSAHGINHWIPFTEEEVNAKDAFESHLMSDYIHGRLQFAKTDDFFQYVSEPVYFSDEAQALMDAGRALWTYYHQQPNAKPNASYYEIRLHFQGVDNNGKMNATSTDVQYNTLLTNLRNARETVRQRIVQGVYKYGFLMQ